MVRLWLALAALCLSACSRDATPAQQEPLVVFAASSLREVMMSLGRGFERTPSAAPVRFSFAGTQELRTQLEHGARADVFASADPAHMDALVGAGLVRSAAIFAFNEPVVVLASDAPSAIQTFDDLVQVERIVVGAAEVPIGKYTSEVLARAATTRGEAFRAQVEAHVVSRELNVRQVLAKVVLGEAQAAFVYRTDALTAGDKVRTLPLPEDVRVRAAYPIGVVSDAKQPSLAHAFVAFARSAEGRALLERAGFVSPPEAPRE